MATATKYIGLWLDKTSDPSDPKWIVSRDTETTTDTVSTHDDYEEAREAAEALAEREGLEVVES